ncbi:MAG: virulence RhuM family protein [Paludibacteraceae bacterium]|nr:virulence RhuM family protein [Paludibacteraceae bacterium]
MTTNTHSLPQSGIEIYTAPDNSIQLQVKLEQDSVWLTQDQMAQLFERDKSVIARHISNIYKEGELQKESTVAKFAIVPTTRERSYETSLYNLDVIISVGYRVKSKRGVQFRQWANKVLKDFLIKGYAVRTNMQIKQYEELKQLVGVLQQTMQTEALTTNEARDLVKVVTDYTYALDTLDDYDYQRLAISDTENKERFHATYENAMEAIRSLKDKFGESWLFGNEKDDSFKSSIGQIYQTFGGQELYPSVEEKAAMLLYLVTKNHSFSDGNKRIAATLFLWFMDRNGILYTQEGHKRIADNTLVALTLMIAESRTEEKDTMVKVVVNLINKKN